MIRPIDVVVHLIGLKLIAKILLTKVDLEFRFLITINDSKNYRS